MERSSLTNKLTFDKVKLDFVYKIIIKVCDQLIVNDFDDWYQPSLDELIMLYTNIHVKDGSGGFRSVKYWSSTYYPNGLVYVLDFSTGKEGETYTNERSRVRAIRRF